MKKLWGKLQIRKFYQNTRNSLIVSLLFCLVAYWLLGWRGGFYIFVFFMVCFLAWVLE